jgi:ABC-type phosphate transport system substrate-binding protein
MARYHRHLFAVLACCCSLWLCSGAALAQEQLAVIVSSKAPDMRIDMATLRSIYLKKVFLSEQDQTLIPVNLPADNPLREAFSQSTLHMNDAQMRSYWNRRYFQGVSPPYVLGSQNAVVRFVADTPGAIGYVRPCHLDPSVRQILLLPLPGRFTGDNGAQCPAPAS